MVFVVAASLITWQLWQFCARGTFWMEACFCNPWHLARESFELKFWEMLVEMVAKGFLGSLSRRGFPEETRINTNRFCWCFHPSCPLSWTFTFFMIPTGYTLLEPFWTLKTTSICVVRRAARIVRLPRSLLDPESFPHTAYVKILATLARKTVNWGCQQRATH